VAQTKIELAKAYYCLRQFDRAASSFRQALNDLTDEEAANHLDAASHLQLSLFTSDGMRKQG